MSDSESPAANEAPKEALDTWFVTVYEQLRSLARQRLAGERTDHTLQPTALVNEVFLRLQGDGSLEGKDQTRFFLAAAEAMRRILIEQARRKQRVRHGGGRQRIELDEVCPVVLPRSDDLLALDEALTRLAAHDPIRAELVKLRFFAGLTMAERYWAFARVWLYAELAEEEKNSPR
jgi:RNA polymerase sigma factor (TIGR02999 family)